jgi:DNA polymerase-3 subunit chi
MTEVRFYHLTRTSLEQVLAELLEKTVERGTRAVVLTSSPERTEDLCQYLWTYNPNSFLPHGSAKDGQAEAQPIWLTSDDERPNEAAYLFLTEGTTSARVSSYARVMELFDGNDPEAVAAARRRWGAHKKDGHLLSYWQQTDKGWVDATPQE